MQIPSWNHFEGGMSTQGLLMECEDRYGLGHAITGVLLKHGVNVVGNLEFVDRPSARLFMRTEFEGAGRMWDRWGARALQPVFEACPFHCGNRTVIYL